jgi:hypothetical protein
MKLMHMDSAAKLVSQRRERGGPAIGCSMSARRSDEGRHDANRNTLRGLIRYALPEFSA